MKKIVTLIAALAAIAFTAPVRAADAPISPYYKAAPAFNWNGFYIGANIGYAFGDVDVAGVPVSADSFIYGAQSGINWQVSRNFVLGIESDINGASNNNGFDYFATVRARAGIADGAVLYYATGGLALGYLNNGAGFIGDRYFYGWTAGVGVEWAFARNWSAKAEYLYVDLGDELIGAVPVSMDFSLVRFGINYHF